MRSNYKKLGRYIRQVDERNSDLAITNLQGVSIAKEFIPSIANIIGTDLSAYKIVRTGQFAYGPVTSRNGDKVSIAQLKGEDCIISSSYLPFEVYKPNELLPEYLMLWFKRPEFDRYARFMSNGSAREVFDWDAMCSVELPVQPLSEQRKIVHDYQVVTERIKLLRKINENLQEQMTAYFESKLGRFIPDGLNVREDVPDGWQVSNVGNYSVSNIATFSEKTDTLLYLDTGSITRNYISEFQVLDVDKDEIPSRARRKVSATDIVYSTVRPNLRHYGLIYNPPSNMIVSTGFSVLTSRKESNVSNEFLYMWLTRDVVVNTLHNIAENSMSTYPSIVSEDLENVKIIVPSEETLMECNLFFRKGFTAINYYNKEIHSLETNLQDIVTFLL